MRDVKLSTLIKQLCFNIGTTSRYVHSVGAGGLYNLKEHPSVKETHSN